MREGVNFYIAVVAFLSGVIFRSFVNLGVWFAVFLLVIGIALAVVGWILRGGNITKIATIAIIAASFGTAGFELADWRAEKGKLWKEGEMADLEALVVDEPDIREKHQIIILEPVGIKSARIMVITELFPDYKYGDLVMVSGQIDQPDSSETDAGRIFDYPAYLAKDGIYYQIFYPQIEKLGYGGGSFIKRALFSIKNSFMDKVHLALPEPHASLLGGLILGIKQSLGQDLLNDFRTVGLIHVVVLSGYNITIIADFIGRLLSPLRSRAVRMIFSALAIILFIILTGASSTIVRAGIMALLVLLARSIGRKYDIKRALFAAAALMVLHNPRILVFDPSFQLSFLATFSLITFEPLMERKLGWLTDRWKIRETVTATISTQIFVLPLLLYMTGVFSLASIPANLLVLLIIPATMLLGFLAGATSFIHSFVALPLGWATYFLLEYQLIIVQILSSIPMATINIGDFPFWGVLASYACLGIVSLLYIRSCTKVEIINIK